MSISHSAILVSDREEEIRLLVVIGTVGGSLPETPRILAGDFNFMVYS